MGNSISGVSSVPSPVYVGTGEQRIMINQKLLQNNKYFTVQDIAKDHNVSVSELQKRNPGLDNELISKMRRGDYKGSMDLVIPNPANKPGLGESAKDAMGMGLKQELDNYAKDWSPREKANFERYYNDTKKNDPAVPSGIKKLQDKLVDKVLTGPSAQAVKILAKATPEALNMLYEGADSAKLIGDVNKIRDEIKQSGSRSLDQLLNKPEFLGDDKRAARALGAYIATFGTSQITDLQDAHPNPSSRM